MNQLVLGAYSQLGDFLELTKPRIALLVLFTTFIGLYLASGGAPDLEVTLFVLFGTCMASAASGVLNNYIDRDIDPYMDRTKYRALASGRVSESAVLYFGVSLSVISIVLLASTVNYLTALLVAFTILFYVFVYTRWLKRKSSWCTEIGGVAGAMPPLIGWSAVSDSLSLPVIFLFVLLFLWQPPHFWALALLRADEYKKVNVPMLPVVAGVQATKRRMLVYTFALLPMSIALCLVSNASSAVYIAAVVINAAYLVKTIKFYSVEVNRKTSMRLFGYSILYIFMMFGLSFFMV